jgi:hypothetical protein
MASSVGIVDTGFVSGALDGPDLGSLSSPQSFPVTTPVPAGTFVSIVIGKGESYESTPITSVTDSEGNSYNRDVSYDPPGLLQAGIAVFSRVLTHALTTSDTVSVAWSGSWVVDNDAFVYGSAFYAVTGLDVAGMPVKWAGGTASPIFRS